MHVLVTGGAGFIGSHAVQRLLADGHSVLAVDNLFRGHREPMDLLGAGAGDRFRFVEADCGDVGTLAPLLDDIDTVMHFGARAYVGESVEDPLAYAKANITSGIGLLEACDQARGGRGVERFIFSSSCSTYGQPAPDQIPVAETCPQSPESPYGRTKLVFEWILKDYAESRRLADKPFSCALLRYFNVAGSDRTGLLGEDHDPETHLIPVAIQAALGRRDGITIFGTDYPTPDGTCVRDYVHVEDLIDAHVRVADRLVPGRVVDFNVGIGKGYSVREIIDSVKRVSGTDFAVGTGDRRAGDPALLFNNPAKISAELGWKAAVTELDEIVGTALAWMQAHPNGYATTPASTINA